MLYISGNDSHFDGILLDCRNTIHSWLGSNNPNSNKSVAVLYSVNEGKRSSVGLLVSKFDILSWAITSVWVDSHKGQY